MTWIADLHASTTVSFPDFNAFIRRAHGATTIITFFFNKASKECPAIRAVVNQLLSGVLPVRNDLSTCKRNQRGSGGRPATVVYKILAQRDLLVVAVVVRIKRPAPTGEKQNQIVRKAGEIR